MNVEISVKLTLSVLVFALTARLSVSDTSPYAPPFLRAVGNSASSPQFLFPQQPPASSGSLIQDNSPYSIKYGRASSAAAAEDNFLNPGIDVQNFVPQDPYQQEFPNSGSENSPPENIMMPAAMAPANSGSPFASNSREAFSTGMNNDGHRMVSGNHQDMNPMHGVEDNSLYQKHPYADRMNTDDIMINRPQLRHLDFVASRNVPNPAIQPARTNVRPINDRRPVQPRSPTQTSAKKNNAKRVSEGHRLITRALWRIFDALMERNEKAELTERMIQVENTVRNIEMPDANKLESMIEMLKEENLGQDQMIMELTRRQEETLPKILERLDKLENWQLTFGQNDEEQPSIIWDEKPAYTSCPPPFEAVEGECFNIGGNVKRSWHDARRDCSKLGADLASPRQLSSLQTYLQSLAYQPEYVWVGASRQGNGEWVWSAGPQEGKLVDRSSNTWNDELPSGLGNCMGLYEGSSYRAYDFSCVEADLYVCQFFL